MNKVKIAALLLVILVLIPGMGACGFTSQGSQEQQRPAESQSPSTQDATESNQNVAKGMEKTAKQEAGEKTEEKSKGT
ncbi:MAG: hypothetical protein LC751_11050 [Actinobacteria bacterium]|nr:hypothetical protein [Actinomycetota bacterium]